MADNEINPISSEANKRLRECEKTIMDLRLEVNKQDLKIALLENEQDHIKQAIKDGQDDFKSMRGDLKSALHRILWAIGMVLLGAVGNFIIQGGLSL